MKAQINIIGAGRLGQHWLAAFSTLDNQVNIQQVVSQHLKPQNNSWSVIDSIEKLKSADITFICVSDDKIHSMVYQLATKDFNATKPIFIHCAGRYNSDLLAPLAKRGALVATTHPLRPFTKQIDANAFRDCSVSIEGDLEALNKIEPILRQLGAQPFVIDKTQKTLYHSACTIASNGLVGLVHAANQIFLACGVKPKLAKTLTLSLIEASLKNCLISETFVDALTGPITREDNNTVTSHLDTLKNQPSIQNLYYHLSEQILSLTQSKESLHAWLSNDYAKKC